MMVASAAESFHISHNRYFDEGIAYCRKQQFEKAYQCFKRHLVQNSFCQETFQMISYCQYKFTESTTNNVCDLSVLTDGWKSSIKTPPTKKKVVKNLDSSKPINFQKFKSPKLKRGEKKDRLNSHLPSFSRKNQKLDPLCRIKSCGKQGGTLLQNNQVLPGNTESFSYQGQHLLINEIVHGQPTKKNDSRIFFLKQILDFQTKIELFLLSLDGMLSNIEILVNSLRVKEQKQNSQLSNLLNILYLHESEIPGNHTKYLQPNAHERSALWWSHLSPHCQNFWMWPSSFRQRNDYFLPSEINVCPFNYENDRSLNKEELNESDLHWNSAKSHSNSFHSHCKFGNWNLSKPSNLREFASGDPEPLDIHTNYVSHHCIDDLKQRNQSLFEDFNIENTSKTFTDVSYLSHDTENFHENQLCLLADTISNDSTVSPENILQPQVGQVMGDLVGANPLRKETVNSFCSSNIAFPKASFETELFGDDELLFQSKYLNKKSDYPEIHLANPIPKIFPRESSHRIVTKRRLRSCDDDMEQNFKRPKMQNKSPNFKNGVPPKIPRRERKNKELLASNNSSSSATTDDHLNSTLFHSKLDVFRASRAACFEHMYHGFQLKKNVAVQTEYRSHELQSVTAMIANKRCSPSTVSLFHSNPLFPMFVNQRRLNLVLTNSACQTNYLNILFTDFLSEIIKSVSSFPIDFNRLILTIDQAPLSINDVKLNLIPASRSHITYPNVRLRLYGHYIEFPNLSVYQVDPYWLRYVEHYCLQGTSSAYRKSQAQVSFVYPERLILHSLSTDLYNLTLLAGPLRIRFVNFERYHEVRTFSV